MVVVLKTLENFVMASDKILNHNRGNKKYTQVWVLQSCSPIPFSDTFSRVFCWCIPMFLPPPPGPHSFTVFPFLRSFYLFFFCTFIIVSLSCFCHLVYILSLFARPLTHSLVKSSSPFFPLFNELQAICSVQEPKAHIM